MAFFKNCRACKAMRGEVSEVETHKKIPPTPMPKGWGSLLLRPRGGSPAPLLCALAWWVVMSYAVGAWCALCLSFGVVCWSALRWGSWLASGGQLYPSKPEQFPSSGADHHAHASGVPPPESLSRCPSGAIFCLSSGCCTSSSSSPVRPSVARWVMLGRC